MAKPTKNNLYVKEAYDRGTVGDFTFCIMANNVHLDGYQVRIFPHNEMGSYWLPGGPWETLSGAKASILNFLDESEE